MKRKHQFKRVEDIQFKVNMIPYGGTKTIYLYRCIYCKKPLCLDEFQIQEMSVELAECKSEFAPKIKLIERITGSVDCLLRKKKGNKNGS